VNAAACLERHGVRNRTHVRSRHNDGLGDRAWKMFAKDSVARAERLFAVATVLARSVAHAAVDDNVVTDGDSCDIGPDWRRSHH
jgi:hypothetical protein